MRSKEKHSIKLPAIKVLPLRIVERLREEAIKPWEFVDFPTYRELGYREEKDVGKEEKEDSSERQWEGSGV